MGIDINDLKVSELKELARLAAALGVCGQPAAAANTDVAATLGADPHRPHAFSGRYVIVRSYSAGVHAGVLETSTSDAVILKDARRLWSWTAKSGVALSGVAVHGLKAGKVDVVVPVHEIRTVVEVIPASAEAEKSIRSA